MASRSRAGRDLPSYIGLFLCSVMIGCSGSGAIGCSGSLSARDATPAPGPASSSAPAAAPEQTMRHLVPAPDSTGKTPTRFAWTPAEGADRYALGLWNEVDVLVWRRDDLREPRVPWPAGFRLDPGTYFWSVTALRAGRPIAESGRAAFVVRED